MYHTEKTYHYLRFSGSHGLIFTSSLFFSLLAGNVLARTVRDGLRGAPNHCPDVFENVRNDLENQIDRQKVSPEPSVRSLDRCMSENTVNAALRRMGYGKDDMTGDGFRSEASSMLNESGLWNPDAIDAQLARVENNAVRRAYARANFWDERMKMMGWWADRLDILRRGAEVVKSTASNA